MRLDTVRAVIVFGLVLNVGAACARHQQATRTECSTGELARIEAAFVAEALEACKGSTSLATCPQAPRIEAKYAARREEWIRCR